MICEVTVMFWLGKYRGCVLSLVCWMELVSPQGLCSEALSYSCFSYCPLSSHGSTSWCLQWGHMALMWRYEWVWTASTFNLSPFIQWLQGLRRNRATLDQMRTDCSFIEGKLFLLRSRSLLFRVVLPGCFLFSNSQYARKRSQRISGPTTEYQSLYLDSLEWL